MQTHSKYLRFVIGIFTFILLTNHGIGVARAGVIDFFPASTKNFFTLNEAAILSDSIIVELVGLPTAQQLNFSGTYSDTGWSLAVQGNYQGLPVSLSYTGIFNQTLDTGTFTSIGTIGNMPWDASGNTSFTLIQADTLIQDADLTLGPGSSIPADRVLNPPKKHTSLGVQPSGIPYTDDGTVYPSLGGVPDFTKPMKERSSGTDGNPNFPFSYFITLEEPNDTLFLVAEGRNGSVNGALLSVPVPEPGTLILVGIGVIFVTMGKGFSGLWPLGIGRQRKSGTIVD
jgi:hypothetical protein